MKVLVLGGTLFLGRHVVAAALGCGHRVTTFTRGRTNPALFSKTEALHGDRDDGLGALSGRTWDAVVDTSAYVPRQAEAAAAALRGQTGRYCLISTASVYTAFPAGGANEDTATHVRRSILLRPLRHELPLRDGHEWLGIGTQLCQRVQGRCDTYFTRAEK